MKKALLVAFFVLSFGAYALQSRATQSADAPVASIEVVPAPSANASSDAPSATTPVSFPAPKPTPTPTPTPTPAPKPKGQYTDGTYTGSVADAYYGNIQVKAVVSGGRLTDVVFLQYPNDRGTSREINQQAMPYLKSEALQAQSANVSGVSGASDTSYAFVESLSSALAQAKA